MQEFGREDRVGALMRRELASLIREQLRDPRVGMVTIQEVRASRDLSHAKVFYTVLESKERQQTEQVLIKAAPFLRRRLAERLPLRSVPELHFVYDKSVAEGMRLSALIEQAIERDQQSHQDD
jgi:ribosome-binding factor A